MSTEQRIEQSYWTKCITQDGHFRGVGVDITKVVREMVKRHGYSSKGAKFFAEASVCSIFLATYCKSGERVNLKIQSSGPVFQTFIDATPEGTVRGYCLIRNEAILSQADVDESSDGPWGTGILSVLKATTDVSGKAKSSQPFVGSVELITGFLAKDFAFYWHQSEQVSSAIGISVKMAPDGLIASAIGFMVQVMGGVPDSKINQIEARIIEIQKKFDNEAITETPLQTLSQIFQDEGFQILEKKEILFKCDCSRERVLTAVRLMGEEEIKDMISKEKGAHVKCDFCSTDYNLTEEDLRSVVGV